MPPAPSARSSWRPLGANLPPAVALLDGNMLAKKAYHTTGDLTVLDTGQRVGVAYGFIKIIGTVMRNFPSVEEIYVLWDSYPSWRSMEFPYYKAARGAKLPSTDPGGENSWEEQKVLLHELLSLIGVHQIRAAGLEADDLAHLVPRSPLVGGRQTILVSNDRDWLQLVDKDVFIFRNPRKDWELITPDNFASDTKYGHPRFVVELKALMGDGDEFPGAPGVGEKTALAYLQNEEIQPFRLRKIESWLQTQQYAENMILASIPEGAKRFSGNYEINVASLDEKAAFSRFTDLEFYSVTDIWQQFWGRHRQLKTPSMGVS